MSNKDELERIKRIRDAQIRARDPGPQVKVQWKGASAKKQGSLFKEIFGVFPGRIQGLLIGLVIGTALFFVVQLIAPGDWRFLFGLAILAGAAGIGMIMGRVLDKRDW